VAAVRSRKLLLSISVGQFGCGVTGLAVAIARRHAYDLPVLHGDPDDVVRNAWPWGTALSAPGPMLVLQALAIGALAARPDPRAARTLGALGVLMVPGYLAERLVRHRLTRDGWDRLESPLAFAGLGLAVGMAGLGFDRAAGWRPGSRVS